MEKRFTPVLVLCQSDPGASCSDNADVRAKITSLVSGPQRIQDYQNIG